MHTKKDVVQREEIYVSTSPWLCGLCPMGNGTSRAEGNWALQNTGPWARTPLAQV